MMQMDINNAILVHFKGEKTIEICCKNRFWGSTPLYIISSFAFGYDVFDMENRQKIILNSHTTTYCAPSGKIKEIKMNALNPNELIITFHPGWKEACSIQEYVVVNPTICGNQ